MGPPLLPRALPEKGPERFLKEGPRPRGPAERAHQKTMGPATCRKFFFRFRMNTSRCNLHDARGNSFSDFTAEIHLHVTVESIVDHIYPKLVGLGCRRI